MIAEAAMFAWWIAVRVLVYGADLVGFMYDLARDFAADLAPWDDKQAARTWAKEEE